MAEYGYGDGSESQWQTCGAAKNDKQAVGYAVGIGEAIQLPVSAAEEGWNAK
jgi:hypothetical protein